VYACLVLLKMPMEHIKLGSIPLFNCFLSIVPKILEILTKYQ